MKERQNEIKRIIIVEDDESMAAFLIKVVTKQGFEVLRFARGEEGLNHLTREAEGLLLLDYRLPDMDGIEFVKAMNERQLHVPFIVLTAHGDEKVAVEMFKRGAKDYIIKDNRLKSTLIPRIKHVMEQIEIEQQLFEAQRALLSSEEQYRTLVENMEDGLFLVQDGKYQFVNTALAKMLGYTVDEMLGLDYRSIVAHEDRKLVTERYEQRRTGRNVPGKYEVRFLHKDAITRICVNISVSMVKYHDKMVAIGTVKNVTDYKQALLEIKSSKEFLNNVINAIDDPCFVKDEKHRWVLMNDTMCEFMGLAREELIGKSDYDIFPKHEADVFWRKDDVVFTTGETNVNEEEITCGGETSIISTKKSLFRDTVTGEKYIVATIRDITEAKNAQRVIEESHAEIENLLKSISSILIGVSGDGKVTRWNKTAEHAFGLDGKKVVGKYFHRCDIKWDRAALNQKMLSCQKEARPVQLEEIRYTRPDGKEAFITLTINPVLNETKSHNGFLILGNDVTERKHLESQLTHAQKLESIGQLAAGIAHEINTPIQYVGDNVRFLNMAFSRFQKALDDYGELLQRVEDGDQLAEQVDAIKARLKETKIDYIVEEIPKAVEETLGGVERVARIVRAMKEFSHPGSAEKVLTDINKALQNTVTVARNEWKYVADLELELDPSLPPVPCLPGELNQVFLNMIINAAHAIQEAVVDDKTSGKGMIKISTDHNDNWVGIRIADTGAGIPPGIRAKIFDPFFTSKEVGKGTGQGLAIANNIVAEKHDGKISFESEVGRGTTFLIQLPISLNGSQELHK